MSEVRVQHKERFGGTGGMPWLAVYLNREARLNEELSEIVHRGLQGVLLVSRDGFGDALTYHLTYEDALKLHRALGDAITAAQRDTRPTTESEADRG